MSFTVVSIIMVHVTRWCVVVPSSCTLSPDSLKSYNIIVCIFLHAFILRNIKTSMVSYLPRIFFYSSPGYVYTALATFFHIYPVYVSIEYQVIYTPHFQHNKLSPESAFYVCVDSHLCSLLISLLSVLSYALFKHCWRQKIQIYNCGTWRQLYHSNFIFASIDLFILNWLC